MFDLDRRSSLALGLAAATSASAAVGPATAAMYGPEVGEEVAPGVRRVLLAERDVPLAGYRAARMSDLVLQRGARTPLAAVANDTVSIMLEGPLRVRSGELEFVAKVREWPLWATPSGAQEQRANTGADVAVVRVIDLLPR
jgi:hypothetical protein